MRNVKIEFGQGYKRSLISKKETGFYDSCTVSLLKNVPDQVSNPELIERWDAVSMTQVGELRLMFDYYELIDSETTAREDYRVIEHNKGDWNE